MNQSIKRAAIRKITGSSDVEFYSIPVALSTPQQLRRAVDGALQSLRKDTERRLKKGQDVLIAICTDE